MYYNDTTSVV